MKDDNKLAKIFTIVGFIAVVAAIAYAVYRFMTPDYLEDFEDDFDDDFDDFFEDEESGEKAEEAQADDDDKDDAKACACKACGDLAEEAFED